VDKTLQREYIISTIVDFERERRGFIVVYDASNLPIRTVYNRRLGVIEKHLHNAGNRMRARS